MHKTLARKHCEISIVCRKWHQQGNNLSERKISLLHLVMGASYLTDSWLQPLDNIEFLVKKNQNYLFISY